MVPLALVVVAVALSAAGAAVGALAGAYLGRAAALDARLEPLRSSIETLADQLVHATRRWNKRDRDAGIDAGPPLGAAERQRRLMEIQKRWQQGRSS